MLRLFRTLDTYLAGAARAPPVCLKAHCGRPILIRWVVGLGFAGKTDISDYRGPFRRLGTVLSEAHSQ